MGFSPLLTALPEEFVSYNNVQSLLRLVRAMGLYKGRPACVFPGLPFWKSFCFLSVLVSVLEDTSISVRACVRVLVSVIREKGALVEKMSPSYCRVDNSVRHFLD